MRLSRMLGCLFLGLGWFLVSVISAQAFEYEVTKLTDDGSHGTLRWAVDSANYWGGDHTITFATVLSPATFHLNDDLEVTANITLVGRGVTNTIIDGLFNGTTFTQCFYISGSLGCSNLTVQNGFDPPPNSADGGAFFVATGGSVGLTNCQVMNCAANSGGGGF